MTYISAALIVAWALQDATTQQMFDEIEKAML